MTDRHADVAGQGEQIDERFEERLLLAERKLRALNVHHETLAQQMGEAVATIKQISDSTREKLEQAEQRMQRVETDLAGNTDTTNRVAHDTREVLEHLATAKSGLKLLGYVGVVVKWASLVATGLVALYVAMHTALYIITHNGEPPTGK